MSGNEIVKLEVNINQGEAIGFIELTLDFLKDQLMHDIWVELTNEQRKSLPGKLHITVQWIHSNKTYYADLLVRLKEKIKTEQAEIQRLETLLQNLHEPYGVLKYLDLNSLAALPEETELRHTVSVMNPSAIIEAPDPPYLDSICEMIQRQNLVWGLLLIIAITCSSIRMDLVNQCIAIAGLCYEIVLKDLQTSGKLKVLIIGLFAACIHDFLWFIITGYVML